jgi:hypothetical protein
MEDRRLPARRRVRRQRKAKTKANITCSNAKRGCKPDLNKQRQDLDAFDVREWFAADPSACISDIAAQTILREYGHASRLWITFPLQDEKRRIRSHFDKAVRVAAKQQVERSRKAARASIETELRESAEKGIHQRIGALAQRARQALLDEQFTPWWQGLQNHLNSFLPEEVVDRFADYLSGFLLVVENETPRNSAKWEDRSKKSNSDWRQLKELLRNLNGKPGDAASMLPASATPPRQEALKTKLIRVMSEELVALDYSRKIIADRFLPFVWHAVGDRILGRSFLRTERRSRHRTTHRK